MTDVPSKHVWKIKESCYVYTNIKLQIKSVLKKISLQLYFKRVNVHKFLRLDDRNNNSNKNIKLQIKSFLKKISLQLYFKRVNVPTAVSYTHLTLPTSDLV